MDFLSHGYHSHLSNPGPSHTSQPISDADLETFVPSLPTGWSTGGISTAAKTTAKEVKTGKKKPRHKLPKGAVVGKPFNEDVSILSLA